jgi:hypothetical protein
MDDLREVARYAVGSAEDVLFEVNALGASSATYHPGSFASP